MAEFIAFICMTLFYICLIGSFLLIGLIIMHFIKKKFKHVKFEIFILIIMILSIGLLKVYHLTVDSANTISYYMVNSENDGEQKFIKLPPESKWLFKTPTDIFTCDLNAKDCKLFFDNELKEMKAKGVIDDFNFDKDRNYFSVMKYSHEIAIIDIIDDGDERRFGILYKYN